MAGSFFIACSACFLTPSETTCPGWHRLLWAVPSHASHSQESVLQTRLLVNLMEAVSQLRVSPSQMCPGCVRLTKTCQHRSHVACVFNAHVCCPSPDAVERERPFRTLGLAFALPVRSNNFSLGSHKSPGQGKGRSLGWPSTDGGNTRNGAVTHQSWGPQPGQRS